MTAISKFLSFLRSEPLPRLEGIETIPPPPDVFGERLSEPLPRLEGIETRENPSKRKSQNQSEPLPRLEGIETETC